MYIYCQNLVLYLPERASTVVPKRRRLESTQHITVRHSALRYYNSLIKNLIAEPLAHSEGLFVRGLLPDRQFSPFCSNDNAGRKITTAEQGNEQNNFPFKNLDLFNQTWS